MTQPAVIVCIACGGTGQAEAISGLPWSPPLYGCPFCNGHGARREGELPTCASGKKARETSCRELWAAECK